MNWHEITIHTTEEAIEMISNFLHELGAGGVSIEESGVLSKERDTSFGQLYEHPLNDLPEGEAEIKGYFADVDEDQINKTILELNASIQGLKAFDIHIGKALITYKIVHEKDWENEWKQYYKPVNISEKLVIKPTWEVYEAKPNEVIIELDPGMAFGTGTHETTALCLRTIERVIQADDDVIDIGTGSGILAIAAAKLGARHVLAIDLDPVAVSSAKENAHLNELDHSITVMKSDLLQVLGESKDQLGIEIPVQLVIANILAEIILQFVDDVYEVLSPGGKYIASGIIRKKEAEVISGLTASGFIIEERFYENDWVAIVARKA